MKLREANTSDSPVDRIRERKNSRRPRIVVSHVTIIAPATPFEYICCGQLDSTTAEVVTAQQPYSFIVDSFLSTCTLSTDWLI